MLFATWLPPQWTFIRQSIMLLALWRRPAKLKHSSNVKIAGPFIMDERRLTGKKSLSNTSGKMVQCWQAASHDSCRRRERQSLVCVQRVCEISLQSGWRRLQNSDCEHTHRHTHTASVILHTSIGFITYGTKVDCFILGLYPETYTDRHKVIGSYYFRSRPFDCRSIYLTLYCT